MKTGRATSAGEGCSAVATSTICSWIARNLETCRLVEEESHVRTRLLGRPRRALLSRPSARNHRCCGRVQNVVHVTVSAPLYPDGRNRLVLEEMYDSQSSTMARRATRGHPSWSVPGVSDRMSLLKERR